MTAATSQVAANGDCNMTLSFEGDEECSADFDDVDEESGASVAEFYSLVESGMAASVESGTGDADAQEVVAVINSVLDFQEFAVWMRDMHTNEHLRM